MEKMYEDALQIRTCKGGYNMGRKYCVKATSFEMCSMLIRDLSRLTKIALTRADKRTRFQKFQVTSLPLIPPHAWSTRTHAHTQASLAGYYETVLVTRLVSGLVLLNFLAACYEAQFLDTLYPADGSTTAGSLLTSLNTLFSMVFAFELCVAMLIDYRPFFLRADKTFDLLIVLIFLCFLTPFPLPLEAVRCTRAMQVMPFSHPRPA